jgi:hypothetical protein
LAGLGGLSLAASSCALVCSAIAVSAATL